MIINVAIFTMSFSIIILGIALIALQKRVDELEKRSSGKPWLK